MEGLLTSSARAKLAGCEVKPSLQSIPPDVDVMLGNIQQPSPVCSLSRQIMYYCHGRTPLYRGGVRASEARRTRRGEPRTAGGGFATDIASHEPTFQGRNKGWEDGEGGGGECGEERHPMLISRSKCPSRMCGVRGRVVPSSKSGPALSADCQGKLCTTVMDALPSI